MDPAKLKVVELRAELAARGLDQKGVKAVLVSRLQAALEQEQQNLTAVNTNAHFSVQQDEPPNINIDQYLNLQQYEVQTPALPDTTMQHAGQVPESQPQYQESIVNDPAAAAAAAAAQQQQQLLLMQQQQQQQQQLQLQQQREREQEQYLLQQQQLQQQQQQQQLLQQQQQQQQQLLQQQQLQQQQQFANQNDEDEGSQSSQSASASASGSENENENDSNDDENTNDQNYEMSSAPVIEQQQQQQQQQQPSSQQKIDYDEPEQMEAEEESQPAATPAEYAAAKDGIVESDSNQEYAAPVETQQEAQQTPESNEETAEKDESPKNGDEQPADEPKAGDGDDDDAMDGTKAEATAAATAAETDAKPQSAEKDGDKQQQDRKRKRSRSKSKSKSPPAKRANRRASPARNTDDFTNEEDEPEFDENAVLLSWYDSDLNLTITKPDLCSARPLSDGALALAWAGARATYGVDHGKVCYEVQVNEINRVQNLSDERNLYELRCGWSILSDNLQLGEAPLSFGYSGCAKKANDNVFSEYGIKYGSRGDVVGVYLDLDSTPCTIEYTVNGEPQGKAFEFNKEDLNGAALYPHVLTKNLAFTVNFGQCSKLLVNEERPNRARRDESSRRDSTRRSNKDTTKSNSPASSDGKQRSESESQKKGDEKAGSEEKEPKAEKTTAEKDDDESVKDADKAAADEEAEKEADKKEEAGEGEREEKEAADANAKEEPAIADGTDENAKEEKCPDTENGDSCEAKNNGSSDTGAAAATAAGDKDKPNESHQKEYSLLPDYQLIGTVGIDNLVRGYERPKTRNECEVILLIGLPGAGKTHWANQHSKDNVEKHYNILGVQNLLSKMTVCGEARKKHHSHGRWERFIDWATRGLHSIQDIAVKKRRNYILDQTNVLASAQRRKMKGYGDFKRIAAVIIPDDATYKERCEKQTEKTVSENALNEMKANFTLPSPDFGWFDEVIYTESNEEESKKKVQEFNEKGNKAVKERDRDSDRGNRRRDDNRDRYGRDRRNWGQSSSDRRWGGRQQNSSSQWMHSRSGMGGSSGGGGRSRDKWGHGGSSGGGGGSNSGNWGRNRYDNHHRDRRHDDRRGGSRDYKDYGRDKRGGGGSSSDKHGSKRDKDNHSSSRSSYSSKSSSSHWNSSKGYDRPQSMSSNSRSYGSSFGSMSSSQQSSANNWASATSNYTPQQQQWLQWQQQGPIMQANQHQNQQPHQQANNTQWWQQQQQQATGNHQGWQNWASYAQAYASNSNGANMAKK